MARQLEKVLIVDDEPHFIKYYVEDLAEEGITVKLITDFGEARRHVAEHAQEYDVMVVDLMTSSPAMESIAAGDPDSSCRPEVPPLQHVEGGLAMGRWVMDEIPTSCSVLVLTNRDPRKISWLDEYRQSFAKFKVVTKAECPAYEFYGFLKAFLAEDDSTE